MQLAPWLRFIESELGFVLPRRQQYWLEQAVLSVAQSASLNSDQLLKRVKTDRSVRQQVFDAVLITESRFFRHTDSLNFIGNQARFTRLQAGVPATSSSSISSSSIVSSNLDQTNLLMSKQDGEDSNALQSNTLKNNIQQNESLYKVWSVGCSRGQEVWSLAMVLGDLRFPFVIYGSDVNHQALIEARKAVYDLRELSNIPQMYRHYVTVEVDKIKVNKQLMPNVHFLPHNLFKDGALFSTGADIIICQNVLIYFRQFDQRDILARLVTQLAEKGYLLLAPGEGMQWQHPQMQRVEDRGVNAWQKVSTD